MPKRKDRWKNKKFVRTPKKTKVKYLREKTAKHECPNCGKTMHGMPHGKTRSKARKLSKTERRPTAMFAGVLCNICRQQAIEEAIKLNEGIKQLEEISMPLRNYVIQARGKIK